ncbi:MAG: MMPL family transporter, partial [Candidatus Aenigmatarchaeota archaeon]
MGVLKAVAGFEYRHAGLLLALVLGITLLLAAGIPKTTFQTDMSKDMPQGLESITLGNKLSETFGGGDTLLVLVSVDRESGLENAPADIRDPRVIELLAGLEEVFESEPEILSVQSPVAIFEASGGLPETLEESRVVVETVPGADGFFNSDYSATLFFISADLGGNEERISSFVSKVSGDLEAIEKPGGIKIELTGSPPLRALITRIIQRDMAYTITLATIIIFFLIVFLKRSLTAGAYI